MAAKNTGGSDSYANAIFTGADLTGATFGTTWAPFDISGATFTGADLTEAAFPNATMTGANLSTAILTLANLLGVLGSPVGGSTATYGTTTCPDGAVTNGTTVPSCVGHGVAP
ncbi:MAG: pentapeptide repeat-containing protein [Acidimicrobiales bacterium]